jgi:hypothetical protein
MTSEMTLKITTVEKDDGDGMIVTFSDGTTAGYVAEELVKLRPVREKADEAGHRIIEGELAAKNS